MSRNLEQELNNRYGTTLIAVGAAFLLTIVLLVSAFLFGGNFYRVGFENYTTYFWATILVLGLSAFIWRRVRFSRQSLRDVLTLRGAGGAISYLQITGISLAAIGGLIAVAGFIATMLSGDFMDSVRATIVTLVILFIGFPRKGDWQKVSGLANKKD